MGSVTSKREQTIVVQPIQTCLTDNELIDKHSETSSHTSTADQELEESDLEDTESITEKLLLLTENIIEEKKTDTYKSLEKDLYILSDINEHFDENRLFDEDFSKAASNLASHNFVLHNASLEVNNHFKKELKDLFVQFSGVKTVCDVVVFCLNKGYHYEENELIRGVSKPFISCLSSLHNFTDANARQCHLLVEHEEFLPKILEALQRLTSIHLEDSMRVCNRTCKFLN